MKAGKARRQIKSILVRILVPTGMPIAIPICTDVYQFPRHNYFGRFRISVSLFSYLCYLASSRAGGFYENVYLMFRPTIHLGNNENTLIARYRVSRKRTPRDMIVGFPLLRRCFAFSPSLFPMCSSCYANILLNVMASDRRQNRAAEQGTANTCMQPPMK